MSKIKPSESAAIVEPVIINGVPIMPLTVTRKQAAALVGCDTKTIDRAIAAKKLRASKGAFGDRVVIRLADIERALDANPA
jgi:hypothetical protein